MLRALTTTASCTYRLTYSGIAGRSPPIRASNPRLVRSIARSRAMPVRGSRIGAQGRPDAPARSIRERLAFREHLATQIEHGRAQRRALERVREVGAQV